MHLKHIETDIFLDSFFLLSNNDLPFCTVSLCQVFEYFDPHLKASDALVLASGLDASVLTLMLHLDGKLVTHFGPSLIKSLSLSVNGLTHILLAKYHVLLVTASLLLT
jgi:hypothetical protein